MRLIGLVVCAGIMPQLFFKNGFLLSYLLNIGFKSSDVLILLSIPSFIMFILSVPFAFYADKYGKKKIGAIGIISTCVGFFLITLAGDFHQDLAYIIVILGIVIFSVGFSGVLAGWFALLSPLVPEDVRGSFFGNLRLTWQIFAIACSLVITFILERNASLGVYQLMLAFFTTLLVIQIFLFLKIPEMEKNKSKSASITSILGSIPQVPGYLPFCAYCFLLMLATGAWPVTLGLLEKNVLLFSDHTIVHMGTMLFIGSMVGFYAGGKMVDKLGTKLVFLVVHFSYFIFLFIIVFRSLVPVSLPIYFSFITFSLGLIQASSSIALTSEMMALTPRENKSVIISICSSLQVGGAAISGVISGKVIEYGILSKNWKMINLHLSDYDTLILFSAVLVFVFTVTLGLIPSVVKTKKVQWAPHASKTL
ncbi:MAG: MFS transporter [Bacteroidetes bacterium]|nr:MFS transporter [Bacteroidota bacterium]